MLTRITTSLLLIVLVQSLTGSTASAQQNSDESAKPNGPVVFSWPEEENMYLLAEEANHHMQRAREALLTMDAETAAIQLRKAAVHVGIAAADSFDHTKRALKRGQRDLEKAADQIEQGTLRTAEDFDLAVARAMHALSEYHYLKASAAWEKKQVRQAGHYLRAAADNMEHATAKAEHRMKAATAQIARESREISRRLIKGTGYAIDDVGTGLEKLGQQIERVGSNVTHTSVN